MTTLTQIEEPSNKNKLFPGFIQQQHVTYLATRPFIV